MRERGFDCCVRAFPAVPMNRPGLRFTVTRHNDRPDIEAFVAALAESVGAVQRTNAQPLVRPAGSGY